jgi:pentatricopeptide repeat protein
MRSDPNIRCNTILNTTVIKMFNLEKNLSAARDLFEEMLKSRTS